MDDRRFDGLTRAFASGASRRSVIKTLLGLGGAAALGSMAPAGETDAARRATPTPTIPKCPGLQVWSNGQCQCPSGVACGPDCCASPEQCCDNACCPAGTICIGEEVCCPQEQMCGGNCCGAGQGCCEVDGCCDGVCVSSGTCCTTGNVCSAANGSTCCAPGLDCCSAGDPFCVDRAAGGCCADADCAGLTDACNAGSCNPTTNQCIAQPVTDGTNCGECASCLSGSCRACESPLECCRDATCVDPENGGCCTDTECAHLTDACNTGLCSQTTHRCVRQTVRDGTNCGACETCLSGVCSSCDEPLECCADSTCVDPASGGCCADADCPTSTDACTTYQCKTHQCVEVETMTCPTGQECLDGACVCTGGADPCGDGNDAACCAAGETCQQVTIAGNPTSTCCPTGTPACLAPDLESVVCCDGNATCQPFSVGPIAASICCEGEICAGGTGVTCCTAGQVCSPVELPGFTVGICCDVEHAGCIDAQGRLYCCEEAGQTCTIDPNNPAGGICCATGVCLNANGSPVCCAGDSTCQPMHYHGDTVDFCCAGEPCLDDDSNAICCDAGETCQAINVAGLTLHTCCDGEACLGPNGIDCCGAGEHCGHFANNSDTIGVCCAEGIDACFGLDGTVGCCSGEGFSCRPFVVPGVVDTEVCCNGAPCAFTGGVACCQNGQVCNETLGCSVTE